MLLVWTILLFVAIELVVGKVVEPRLYGARTGLSSVALIAAAIFWTWLWGPIGLLLSTPLTVCLGVLGRHVPQLQFLDMVLGNEPVLRPEETFYQRLLASDPEEASEQAEEFAKERSLAEFFARALSRWHCLAADDSHRGLPHYTRELSSDRGHRHRYRALPPVDLAYGRLRIAALRAQPGNHSFYQWRTYLRFRGWPAAGCISPFSPSAAGTRSNICGGCRQAIRSGQFPPRQCPNRYWRDLPMDARKQELRRVLCLKSRNRTRSMSFVRSISRANSWVKPGGCIGSPSARAQISMSPV
jgi:hypothetical protein